MIDNLISIIVPVYNAEKYLSKCIESLINQTYKNLQIILVDDGSTDSSGFICDSYAMRDSRIEVYHQVNMGQASARNTALGYAKGEWIGFADNDDVVEPMMYEKLLNNAINNNVLISGCATLKVQEDGKCYNTYEELQSGVYNSEKFILAILYQTKYAWGAMWNKLWHFSLKDDLYFPDGMQLEDYWVSLKLYHKVEKLYFDNKPMYHWSCLSSSQSHKPYNAQKLTIMEVSKKIADYFEEVGTDREKNAGYYFDFLMRTEVINSMVRTGDTTIINQAKQYIKDTWKIAKKIKFNSDIPYKRFLKSLLKLFRAMM